MSRVYVFRPFAEEKDNAVWKEKKIPRSNGALYKSGDWVLYYKDLEFRRTSMNYAELPLSEVLKIGKKVLGNPHVFRPIFKDGKELGYEICWIVTKPIEVQDRLFNTPSKVFGSIFLTTLHSGKTAFRIYGGFFQNTCGNPYYAVTIRVYHVSIKTLKKRLELALIKAKNYILDHFEAIFQRAINTEIPYEEFKMLIKTNIPVKYVQRFIDNICVNFVRDGNLNLWDGLYAITYASNKLVKHRDVLLRLANKMFERYGVTKVPVLSIR